MHRTRHLLSPRFNNMAGTSKLLLPVESNWERIISSFTGAWHCVFDSKARDEFIEMTEKNIIRENVLMSAASGSLGSVLMFDLFQNLRNDLWKEHEIDIKEFLDATGPALENFHDVLGQLRNKIAEDQESDHSSLQEKLKSTDEDLLEKAKTGNIAESLLGQNTWLAEAKEDKESLAGMLTKMTTPVCLEALYYSSKLDMLALPQIKMIYEPGSCQVLEAALVNARVMMLHDHGKDPDVAEEYEEFKASEGEDPPVAAQIDILYEVKHKYNQTPLSLLSNDESKESTDKMEKMSYTTLVVAVFEGWLHGGPEKELRWRLAMLREPYEFAYSGPTVQKES